MKRVLIYGPHADQYSLAQVNRELAIALEKVVGQQKLDYQIEVSARAEDVSRLPAEDTYQRYPALKQLYKPFSADTQYDVLIYNNFPKDPDAQHGLSGFNAKVKLAYLAWEEDRFPQRWVNEYNQNLNGVLAASYHTLYALRRSGVTIPITIIPNCISSDFKAAVAETSTSKKIIHSNKKFKFLHNSSGLERKGVRELITAYTKAFTNKDDVCLVIKSFYNANNQFPELIAQAQRDPNCPEIEYISDDSLSHLELVNLYKSCQAYVSPSRAEGFNLPVMEAMYLGLPTLVTGWGGHMDFCADGTNYLLDYELVPAQSHLNNPGGFWAQVKVDDLVEKMQLVVAQNGDRVQKVMTDLARKIAEESNWLKSANKLLSIVAKFEETVAAQNLKLGVISTFNSICGIAEYSKYLYTGIVGSLKDFVVFANTDPSGRKQIDPDFVQRVWSYGEVDFAKLWQALEERPIDIAHIQYNLNFYPLESLAKLIDGLVTRGVTPVLTAHTVQLPGSELGHILKSLEKLGQIHVLNHLDEEYLLGLGLKNVHYFPHGNSVFPRQSQARIKKNLTLNKYSPVIASHGFMIQNKGILETLSAISILKKDYPNILYLAVNAVNPDNMSSQSLKQEFDLEVSRLELTENVVHLDEFLEPQVIALFLGCADVVLCAYGQSNETASGAVRLAMGTQRPLLITRSNQLADLRDIASVIEDNAPDKIAAGIREIIQNVALQSDLQQKSSEFAEINSWDMLNVEYLKLISRLSQSSSS